MKNDMLNDYANYHYKVKDEELSFIALLIFIMIVFLPYLRSCKFNFTS